LIKYIVIFEIPIILYAAVLSIFFILKFLIQKNLPCLIRLYVMSKIALWKKAKISVNSGISSGIFDITRG